MAISNSDPLLGKVIQGYEILDIIGRGGFGAVYLARHPNLRHRFVAVKYVEVEDLRDAADVRREISILERLDYRYIVRIENTFPFDNVLDQTNRPRPRLIMMEYVRGGSLQSLTTRMNGSLLNYNTIIKCIGQIASALNYVHSEDILHLDLKPANILIRPNPDTDVPDFVLTDFGIAQFTRPGEELSRWGGTPPYMSPEHFSFARGKGPDHRSDIYSLGMVMYQLVTGDIPFKGPMHEVALKHLEEPVPRPSALVPDVPPDLERIIMRTLMKDRDKRYQSAAELRAALTDLDFSAIREAPTRVPDTQIGQLVRQIVSEVRLPEPQVGKVRLLVIDPEGAEREESFEQMPVIVGRSSQCDLVLPSNHISRQHVRIDSGANASITVTDLNSTHGTYLNDKPLTPNEPAEYTSDHWLYINDYSLRLLEAGEQPVSASPADVGQTSTFEPARSQRPPVQATVAAADLRQIAGQLQAQSSPPRLDLEISPEIVYVQFGRPEYVTIRVRPVHVDHAATYRLQISHGSNFDPAWCSIARPKVIQPGEVGLFDVAINLPHTPSASAFELVLGVVADDPRLPEAARVLQVMVQRQVDYRVALNPNRVTHRRLGSARSHLTITNTGSQSEQFTIEIEAPQALHIDLAQTQVTVGAGQKQDVDLRLRASGTEEVFLPYTLHVALPGIQPRSVQGTYIVVRRRSPLWRWLRVLIAAIILGVILALIDQYLLDQRLMLELRRILDPILSLVS